MTNDDTPRAATYIRVSTDEQGERGYSIPDQMRELRACVEAEGYELVEETVDDGYSGANPNRPGLARVMELAEAGKIDLVIAAKRDRLFRSKLHRLLWQRDLEEMGVKLVALNDTGSMLADGFLDDFAEYEREIIKQRTTAGRLQKARQGRLVAASTPGHGFRYTEDREALEVDEEAMSTVQRIFTAVAGDQTFYGVVRDLNRDGVPGPRSSQYPNGAPSWNHTAVRDIIKRSIYREHTVEELAAEGVSPEVLATLDPEGRYGIWRYQGIPIPTARSGIPRDIVDVARAAISSNRRPFYNGGRSWVLSGGIFRCPTCGAAMETSTARGGGRGKAKYPYYRCGQRYNRSPGSQERCGFNRHVPAEWAEEQVWRIVTGFMDDEAEIRDAFDRYTELFRRSASAKNLDRLAGMLAKLDRRRSGYLDLAADGDMNRDDLRTKLADVDEQRCQIERELKSARGDEAMAAELEILRDMLIEGVRLGYYRHHRTPQERRKLYLSLGLRVTVEGDKVIVDGSFLPTPVSGIVATSSPGGTTSKCWC